ncbi:four-carbon acid sugar kinase family protein [Goodfellowiella coeruleoviolacea]|uniref:4-hydroxythreonine-4-phosphate dehydrogenase n=1 Tax=Goodfellowiella coeruleoviolacea TaxID=334858 RepID=A0AAE3KMI2_9PSEU|nr:four-carbon acid sugar kinase family protein [Goodfellowiella coeruleoviolacea]MCP2167633.1 4-hydroxythreonine-4-phosphate dehydrogenase [Goodfellowiella coeruleoviolacea]
MPDDHAVPVFAVADDLSGAAETAIALGMRGTRTLILATPHTAPHPHPHSADVLVLDLDTRTHTPDNAAHAITTALTHRRPGDRVFKKIDSLLRGNLAAEITALTRHGYGIALTPALPHAHRTVTAGVLHLAGTPLHTSDAWRAERATPPTSIAAALAPAPTHTLGLDLIRHPGTALADAFTHAAATGQILICDAETDRDLDAIARAATRAPLHLALAGSGGLAAALGRTRRAGTPPLGTPSPGTPSPGDQPAPTPPPLIVVGTAEPIATTQVARLTGYTVHSLHPDDLAAGPVPLPPLTTPTVLRVDPTAPLTPSHGRAIATGLALTVAALTTYQPPALVLIGGDTARRVLDALGVTTLHPLDQIHPGAVRSRTPSGTTVVTRPGSFGGPDSLVQIVRALHTPPPAAPSERPSP